VLGAKLGEVQSEVEASQGDIAALKQPETAQS
jgi:hypothetical protein